MQMNRNPQNGLKSLSIEKPLGFLIKKLSKKVPHEETCFRIEKPAIRVNV